MVKSETTPVGTKTYSDEQQINSTAAHARLSIFKVKCEFYVTSLIILSFKKSVKAP